jgi:A/G-specific adenine glycosylase
MPVTPSRARFRRRLFLCPRKALQIYAQPRSGPFGARTKAEWLSAVARITSVPTPHTRFTQALIEWHARHGRHDLPWQKERTPYRIWVSEIMLQQTQVASVIPYYERFVKRFADVLALAAAPLDDVLHLWTGLGYYARARNLHRAAVLIREEMGGEFPRSMQELMKLPGIGRSTAGAILALSCGESHPILDGNAKRVLARYFAVTGASTDRAAIARLWQLAERCTPQDHVAVYTQAIMDLGATVCVRRKPLCAYCPLFEACLARKSGRQHEIPAPRPARARRTRQVFMLVAVRDDRTVLLERRPESGVWGGLWCLPEFNTLSAARVFADQTLSRSQGEPEALAQMQHSFTHFDLVISPLLTHCGGAAGVMDDSQSLWYNTHEPARIGLPAPIKNLLDRLADPTLFDEPAAG